jgi:hypothetical protein
MTEHKRRTLDGRTQKKWQKRDGRTQKKDPPPPPPPVGTSGIEPSAKQRASFSHAASALLYKKINKKEKKKERKRGAERIYVYAHVHKEQGILVQASSFLNPATRGTHGNDGHGSTLL